MIQDGTIIMTGTSSRMPERRGRHMKSTNDPHAKEAIKHAQGAITHAKTSIEHAEKVK